MTRETIVIRLQSKQQQLKLANEAFFTLLSGGVKSYTIGSRSLSRFDLPALEDTIARLEKEIDELEAMLENGGKRRKAVGVVPRDV